MKKNRIIIAGSRSCPENSPDLLVRVLKLTDNMMGVDIEIVSGTCRGADKFGEWFANQFGFSVKQFHADWSLGKKAGYVRNKQMAEYSTHLILLWDMESKGSANMLKLAEEYGLKIRVIDIRPYI